jgi:hypothetical protein
MENKNEQEKTLPNCQKRAFVLSFTSRVGIFVVACYTSGK